MAPVTPTSWRTNNRPPYSGKNGMHRTNKDTYLLDYKIEWRNQKAAWTQKWFRPLQVIAIVAAASITFLSRYVDDDHTWIQVSIGLLGLLIAAVTAFLSLYRFQENWIEYRVICESLKDKQNGQPNEPVQLPVKHSSHNACLAYNPLIYNAISYIVPPDNSLLVPRFTTKPTPILRNS